LLASSLLSGLPIAIPSLDAACLDGSAIASSFRADASANRRHLRGNDTGPNLDSADLHDAKELLARLG
jgi:hypothetical protein